MKNFEEHEFNELEEQVKSAFSAAQTTPNTSVKQALTQHLKTRQHKGFWLMLSNLVQRSIPAYQLAALVILAGCLGWSLKPTVLQQPALPTVPQIQYVYKTDTLKVPIIQYVYEKKYVEKPINKRKNTEETENSIPEDISNNSISFPDENMRLAENQTGRSLHDDSTYTKLFVASR